MRFRSIPFQTPTTKLPTSDNKETLSKPKVQTSKQGRAHDRKWASAWQEHNGEIDKDDETGKSDEKQYLNPKQKKKITFINQEFHSSADTIHGY
jgi:nucleolar protein 12